MSWFDTAKGFGFLTPAAGGPAVFVDYITIDVPGYKTLAPGQPVAYLATDTDRGPEATRVIPDPSPTLGCHHTAGTTRLRRSRWTARRLPGRDVFGQ
ncbi:cold-shock protein [Nocardia yamanashiensis]|uniref:cold-shock protein n=1 Tax=Nocardia yamanashiensis TaxID=209247 RepID=UPI0038CDA4FD